MTGVGAFSAGLAVGVIGSVHCVAMCGGIASALAMSARSQPRRRTTIELVRHLLYGFGRVSSYALAGAIAGAFGSAAAAVLGPAGTSSLRALAAALIVALGLYLGGWWSGLAEIERAGAALWRRIAPITRALRPRTSMPGAFVLGMLWGWLPCGLVYSALALAATAGGAASGAALMIGFGAGTVPAVLATGLAAARIGAVLRASASRQVAGAMVVAFGVWTLAGAGLLPLPGTRGASEHCAGHSDSAVSEQQ
ncbi:MAG: sulfite exporter TauE/SafE family protein [Deltaproteobacteria bacterium]|nr:sulfite exporter TauE/SafE family protein [Deltaproteobacteria bacterium]